MLRREINVNSSNKQKTLYGKLPPKITAALKLWKSVHNDLIGPYAKSIRQKWTGVTIIKVFFA